MKILFLTQYYPPEIGAPQNRLHELAVRLKAQDITVDVLTAMPNYPKMEVFSEYRSGEIKEEIIDGIQVFRSFIYVSPSKSILPRLLNYFSFVISSYFRGRKLGKYDYLLVESPPLFLGYSAMALSRKLKAKMIFNVSDLWPESAEKLEIVTNKRLLNMAYNLEKKCYMESTLITGQTQGIVDNIKGRFPDRKVYWLPNGVDVDYYNPDRYESKGFRQENGFNDSDVIFFYGGILGYAQGLTTVIEAAEKVKHNPNIQLILQGAGPEKEALIRLKEEKKLNNIHFLQPVPKVEMPYVLKEVDVALVPLRKLELFQGAIPSKIFEALAMKKPLLLGVEGEAKFHFIDNAKAGLSFEPENVADLAEKMIEMAANSDVLKQQGERGRKYVSEFFNRNKIAEGFIQLLQNN